MHHVFAFSSISGFMQMRHAYPHGLNFVAVGQPWDTSRRCEGRIEYKFRNYPGSDAMLLEYLEASAVR